MPQKRVYVPVSDETRAKLQIYADARRSSLAAVCGELLDQTAPIAEEMGNALVAAQGAPAKAIREMQRSLDEQLADLDQIKLDLTPKATRKKRKTG